MEFDQIGSGAGYDLQCRQKMRKDLDMGPPLASGRCRYQCGMELPRHWTSEVEFYFAGGGAGATCHNLVGVPHEWALRGDGGYIWFAMMPTDSPTLLGLDWIEAAGFMMDSTEGVLRHRSEKWDVPLQRPAAAHRTLGSCP